MFWTAIHDSKTDDVIRARRPKYRRGAATCCLVRNLRASAARGLGSGIFMANTRPVFRGLYRADRCPGRRQTEDGKLPMMVEQTVHKSRTHETTR